VLTNGVAALISMVKDPSLAKAEFWAVVAPAISGDLGSPNFQLFLRPLKLLLSLKTLSQQQLIDLFHFLEQLFASVADPPILVICAAIGADLEIQEDTTLLLEQAVLPFAKRDPKRCLTVISLCLHSFSIDSLVEVDSVTERPLQYAFSRRPS
jgi:hypothetical protein